MCPHCGRDAPIVYRGVVPYCTACGGLRLLEPPLATPSLNLAGKPSQMGGTVASVAGWLVLVVGLSLALGLGLLFAAVFTTTVGLAVGLPAALISAGVGALLLRGGNTLRRSGADAQRATRDQALLSLAGHQGRVTAIDAARLLNVTVGQADAMLTELAKREPERITLDVDDHGVVWYRIARPFGDDADCLRGDASIDVGANAGDNASGQVRVGGDDDPSADGEVEDVAGARDAARRVRR